MNSTGTVIVIGGGSGMGLAVARRCLTAGASVVIAGRSPERLHAALAELDCPDRMRAVTADVAHAIGYLMDDDFVTGTVLHAEGGQLLV